MTPYSDPDMRRKAARDSMARRREDPAVREAEAEAKRQARENSRTMNALIARSRGQQIATIDTGPPTPAANQAVNRVILDAYRRGHTVGDMASRAAGEGTPTERGEQLAALEHELEQLRANGATPGEIELADRAVEALLAEARANSARPRGEDGRFITAESFDGGVRRAPGQRARMPAGHGDESSTALMRRAMEASARERRERGDDERTIQHNYERSSTTTREDARHGHHRTTSRSPVDHAEGDRRSGRRLRRGACSREHG